MVKEQRERKKKKKKKNRCCSPHSSLKYFTLYCNIWFSTGEEWGVGLGWVLVLFVFGIVENLREVGL